MSDMGEGSQYWHQQKRIESLEQQLTAKDAVINTAKIALTIACRYAKKYDGVPFIAGEQALKTIDKELNP